MYHHNNDILTKRFVHSPAKIPIEIIFLAWESISTVAVQRRTYPIKYRMLSRIKTPIIEWSSHPPEMRFASFKCTVALRIANKKSNISRHRKGMKAAPAKSFVPRLKHVEVPRMSYSTVNGNQTIIQRE
jgi:hypothetical protein